MGNYRIDNDFLKTFGSNLRKIRMEKGLTQEELAHKANMTFPQIGRLERGEINSGLSIISDLAKALEVEPKKLFDF